MGFLLSHELEILKIFGGVGVRNAHFANASAVKEICKDRLKHEQHTAR